MKKSFASVRASLSRQFEETEWISESGLSPEELERRVLAIEEAYPDKALAKAKTFALIARHARIAVDRDDRFQDKLMGCGLLLKQRKRWRQEAVDAHLREETAAIREIWKECGAFTAHEDFGHVSPNTRLLLQVGFRGLLDRVTRAGSREGLTEHQETFYLACKTVLSSMMTVAERLADAVLPYDEENAASLRRIATGTPETLYDAMQLLVLYFFLHEYVAGARVRTLGRLDVLLQPFYERDLQSGRLTEADVRELLRFFLHKFWSAKVPYDLPFCLGGCDRDGRDVTCRMSWLIVETYDELSIYSPKIHIRVSEKTPVSFVKRVLDCIRRGNSSFVFVNDAAAVKGLCNVGIDPSDAADYVPIGCYEPAVWGVEIGCTGNGAVTLPKAIELTLNRGRDLRTGILCGVDVGALDTLDTFDAFLSAIKTEITHMTRRALLYVSAIERHYREIYPDAILSSQYEESVRRGVDVYEGGAKYNNSSLYFYSIATLVDAVSFVRYLVYEEKRLSLGALAEILRQNWEGHETLRQEALHFSVKYGNANAEADALAVEFSEYCAALVNRQPNGRGGVFKAALFTIDNCFHTGKLTMATPDGRRAGEPLSKNLCASTAMDKNGVTALIRSVTRMDHSRFPNGSVLDVVLHPSAVTGEDGLEAFYALLATYFRLGGFAMHGNVFRAEELKRAQADPDAYRTLQVRVCGWNAYFVNLSKEEQDAFIRQAENAE